MTEISQLIIGADDRVMSRDIPDEAAVAEPWRVSLPISGRVIGVWRIYQGIQVALIESAGKFKLLRSEDAIHWTVVHSHDTEIYGLWYLDDGHMIFSATDGWWKTTDTGVVWTQFSEVHPSYSAIAILGADDPSRFWHLVAYGTDKVVRYLNYPDGEWAESVDSADYWTGKWYPAIAGSYGGVFIGVGPYLMRSSAFGASAWQTVQTFDGIIKRILFSDQGHVPTVLIEVEAYDSTASLFYRSYDMGDSVTADRTRVGPVADAQSVYPTATSQRQTRFAVLGRRSLAGSMSCVLIDESRS